MHAWAANPIRLFVCTPFRADAFSDLIRFNPMFLKRALTTENPPDLLLIWRWWWCLNHASIIAVIMNGLQHLDSTFQTLLLVWGCESTQIFNICRSWGPLASRSRCFSPHLSSVDGVLTDKQGKQQANEQLRLFCQKDLPSLEWALMLGLCSLWL